MLKSMPSTLKRNLLLLSVFLSGILVSHLVSTVVAHGGDLNLIHGCVRKGVGILRIVGANQKCDKFETPLDWNIQGPANTQPFFCTGCSFVSNIVENKFVDQNLTDAVIGGSFLRDTNFTNTNLTGGNMVNISSENIQFINTNLTNVNAKEASILTANFQGSNLTGINFTDTDLTGSINLDTTTRTGVIWANTICPDATNSDTNGGTCEGHLTP